MIQGLLIQLRLSCRTLHLSFAPATPLARYCLPRLSVLIPKENVSPRLSRGRVDQEDRGVAVPGGDLEPSALSTLSDPPGSRAIYL